MTDARREVSQDTALGMATVFRPLRKGKREKLDVEMPWRDCLLRWRGPDQLGIADQSVLLAVMEVAREQWLSNPEAATVRAGDRLWALLTHEEDSFRADIVRVTTSYRRLALLAGYTDGGHDLLLVRRALGRLAETTVWATRGRLTGSSHLLGWQVGDDHEVVLVLNWRLSDALHGVQYSRISMTERHELRTEAARALHAVLCCKLNPGRSWPYTLDRLQRYVWGDAPADAATRRQRIKRLRAALEEIGGLPRWRVTMQGDRARVARGRTDTKGQKGAAAHAGPGKSVTPRENGHESPGNQSRAPTPKPSIHAGHELVDVSVLLLQLERQNARRRSKCAGLQDSRLEVDNAGHSAVVGPA